jgi:predicted Zn-dependent peptidase
LTERIFCDRLPNGVRVLTEEIPYVLSATVGIWVAVGSAHEPPALSGACHALEHILFKGTRQRSARDIAETLDAVGGQLNAFTDKEFTCYHAKVLSEHLPLAVDLLCDMLLNSLFRPADIRLEKRVILEEIRQIEDEPDELVHDLLLQRMWQGHPLGRPVIGTRGTVRALDRDRLLEFMSQHYTGDRVLVATAGNVRHQDVLAQVSDLLGELPPTGHPSTLPPPRSVPFTRRVTRDTEQVHLCLGVPGYSQLQAERYPLAVLDTLLGGASSSRLFQEIREKRGLAYTIGSCALSYRDGGVLAIYAGTSPDTADQVLDLVRQEFDRVLDEGVQEREVEQVRSQLKGSMLLALEGTGARMTRIAKSQFYFGRVIPIEEIVRDIDRVTTDDVNRVARAILPAENTSVVVLGPRGKGPRRRRA